MYHRTDVAYRYDRTFEGLLSCAFESFERKELPFDVCGLEDEQTTFFETRRIRTEPEKAARVQRGIVRKISLPAAQLVYHAYLSCLPRREVCILRFLHKGFSLGPRVMDMLTDEDVYALNAAAGAMLRERHLLAGFIRFSDADGVLVAVIHPKNRVLPLLIEHFQARLGGERFMIYDATHREALLSRREEARMLELEAFEPPAPDAKERRYRELWREFYQTVEIEERRNPRLRMSHLPKRFWQDMTEFQGREGEASERSVEDGAARICSHAGGI